MSTGSVEITTLIENQPGAHRGLAHEHGLSFLIERGDTTILFDTGQSGAFVDNAALLGKDLSRVEHVVISHGHYDHTNGFPRFVEEFGSGEAGPAITLHVHEDFFTPKYALHEPSRTFIGVPWDRAWLDARGIPVQPVSGDGHEIVPGIHIVTGFDRTYPREVDNPRFVIDRDGSGKLVVDDFRDEIAIVVETPRGLLVVVGCSHPGIMNILDTIRNRFPAPVFAVLGGSHLVEAHGERLEEAIAYLGSGPFTRLGLSHCTGEEAMARLESLLKDQTDGDEGSSEDAAAADGGTPGAGARATTGAADDGAAEAGAPGGTRPLFYRNVTGSSLSI
jgi:7,8-dihydropterin-6-yl-methyl-4-(beta-D-ribofuranosyl)aminobenzene 5'-phosphate synthase